MRTGCRLGPFRGVTARHRSDFLFHFGTETEAQRRHRHLKADHQEGGEVRFHSRSVSLGAVTTSIHKRVAKGHLEDATGALLQGAMAYGEISSPSAEKSSKQRCPQFLVASSTSSRARGFPLESGDTSRIILLICGPAGPLVLPNSS